MCLVWSGISIQINKIIHGSFAARPTFIILPSTHYHNCAEDLTIGSRPSSTSVVAYLSHGLFWASLFNSTWNCGLNLMISSWGILRSVSSWCVSESVIGWCYRVTIDMERQLVLMCGLMKLRYSTLLLLIHFFLIQEW
jgi:hypothetical protein